ncbi:uncharacterized protein [Elaeis guineensis]|uniref:uncharacterized protein isoform X2 n=1 Tax=Elaeis guineensis var. tenera TaxID=51953 RepID=UPI00057B022C
MSTWSSPKIGEIRLSPFLYIQDNTATRRKASQHDSLKRDPGPHCAKMGLWTLLEGFLLLANALAILNEDRFLGPRGWSFSEVSGTGRAKSLKGQLIGLIYATQYLRVPLIILNVITILVKLVSG